MGENQISWKKLFKLETFSQTSICLFLFFEVCPLSTQAFSLWPIHRNRVSLKIWRKNGRNSRGLRDFPRVKNNSFKWGTQLTFGLETTFWAEHIRLTSREDKKGKLETVRTQRIFCICNRGKTHVLKRNKLQQHLLTYQNVKKVLTSLACLQDLKASV